MKRPKKSKPHIDTVFEQFEAARKQREDAYRVVMNRPSVKAEKALKAMSAADMRVCRAAERLLPRWNELGTERLRKVVFEAMGLNQSDMSAGLSSRDLERRAVSALFFAAIENISANAL